MEYKIGIAIGFIVTILNQLNFYKAVDTKDIPEILKTGTVFIVMAMAWFTIALASLLEG